MTKKHPFQEFREGFQEKPEIYFVDKGGGDPQMWISNGGGGVWTMWIRLFC